MKLLRDDLITLPRTKDQATCELDDPETGKRYEFDEQEYYLINAIRYPYNEVVLLAKFNAQFRSNMGLFQLKEFLYKLEGWGLLNVQAELAAVDPKDSGRTTERGTASELEKTSPQSLSDPEEKSKKQPGTYYLFCPEGLLRYLVSWFGFTRYLVKLLPILVMIALTSLLFNLQEFSADHAFTRLDRNLFTHMIFTLFTINLGTVLVTGGVSRHFGIPTPVFGIVLAFGLIPRFSIPVGVPPTSQKRVKLWLASAPILTRCVMFSAGILIWMITRESGNQLHNIGSSLAWVALVTMLFTVNPLMESSGYRWLAIYFDKPDLRQKAFRALKYSISKQPAVIAQYVDTSAYLKVYALACSAFIIALLVLIAWILATWLENNYRGLGVAVFVLLVIYQLRRRMVSSKVGKRQMSAGNAHRFIEGDVNLEEMRQSSSKAGQSPLSTLRDKIAEFGLIRLSVILIIGACMFIPYSYESGGEAVVAPYLAQNLYPETPGVVEHVYFDGGEFLEQGTIIAEMANYRQKKDVDVTQQQILKAEEELAVLLSTPSPEEIVAAEEQLTTAQLQLEFSVTEEARLGALIGKGFVSETEHEKAVEEMQVDKQVVREREAALAALKAQVNTNAIESLRIDIVIGQRNLKYYQEVLERTRLRMPFDGSIVTMNLRNLENAFLDEGMLFAEVEDSSRLKVEIAIPEADAGEIALGNRVRLKLEAFPDKIILGEVTSISQATDESQFGAVLSVVGVIDNKARLIKSGMTGHAKVEARDMFLIEAFTRSLLRFVRVEMWSWLP